jgi:hypothetical protein
MQTALQSAVTQQMMAPMTGAGMHGTLLFVLLS